MLTMKKIPMDLLEVEIVLISSIFLLNEKKTGINSLLYI